MNDQDRETLAARADFATTQKELAKLQLEHRAVEAEVERLRVSLAGGIEHAEKLQDENERLRTKVMYTENAHTQAEARIDAALALHVQDREEGEDVHGCLGCHEEWPCPTVEALKGEGESPEPLTAEGCMCPCHHVGGQPQIGTCEDCDSMHKGEGEKSPRRRLILGVADQLAEDAEDLEKP